VETIDSVDSMENVEFMEFVEFVDLIKIKHTSEINQKPMPFYIHVLGDSTFIINIKLFDPNPVYIMSLVPTSSLAWSKAAFYG